MKNNILFCLLFVNVIFSQGFTGFLTDNYAGVHNVINNPAEIVDSYYRTDINLASFNIAGSNDYYSFDLFEALKSGAELNDISTTFPSSNNNLHINYDALGPSFMMNLTPRSSIAVFSRARTIIQAADIDGAYLEDLEGDVNTGYDIKNQNFSISSNAWAELGFSYAHILKDSPHHKVKIGVSAKYLVGIYTGYIKANNFSLNYNPNAINLDEVYSSTGNIETGNINNFDNVTDPSNFSGSGLALDLGFSYEYRPQIHYYKYKIAASITDLGYLNYKDTEIKVFDATAQVSESDFNNLDFENFYTLLSSSNSIKMTMPTAFKTQADLNLNNRYFINLSSQFNLVNRTKENANYLPNSVFITPRLQYKWLSLYLPVGYRQFAGTQAGFGFRAGPLVIGSGSIVSSIFEKTKAVDAYMALKIPVFRKKGTKDDDFFK